MTVTSARLGQIVNVKGGKRLPAGTSFSSEKTSRPYIRGQDIRDGRIRADKQFYITEDTFLKISRYTVDEGDVCITIVGNIGDVGVTPPDLAGANLTENAVKLIPITSELDRRFLAYALLSPEAQQQMKLSAAGAAQPKLGIYKINEIQIPFPRFQAQKRVASILTAYDNLIENNTRRIAILEEMARRIYEEWFVRFRFPGHEDAHVVESELGFVPEGWSVMTLGKLAEVNACGVRRGAEPTEIRYVDISSVSTASIDNKERMLFADAPSRARRIVRDGDVIWACVRPNRKSYALIVDPEPDLIVSTGFAVLSPLAAPSSFIYQCVTTHDFVSYLVNHAKGAAYPAVGAEDFENAMVLKPVDDLIAAFDRIAEPMMRLISKLQAKNTNLRTTRDLLLPKLISGEIDVSAVPAPESIAA